MINTDYVITETRRADSGGVTYFFTDTRGQRYHLTVPYRLSTRDQVDRSLRYAIEFHRNSASEP